MLISEDEQGTLKTPFSRRSLFRVGGIVTAGAYLGVQTSIASAAGADVPAYLTRAAYTPLIGSSFSSTHGTTQVELQLQGVEDLSRAAQDTSLVGADDAFVLVFSGPEGDASDQVTTTLTNPQLGSFELFVAPVGPSAASMRYEAIVDRTIKLAGTPGGVPTASSSGASTAGAVGSAIVPGASTNTHASAHPATANVLHRSVMHRSAHGASIELDFAPGRHPNALRAWLKHGSRLVGAVAHNVHGEQISFVVHSAHHLAAGSYTLILELVADDGTLTSVRRTLVLR